MAYQVGDRVVYGIHGVLVRDVCMVHSSKAFYHGHIYMNDYRVYSTRIMAQQVKMSNDYMETSLRIRYRVVKMKMSTWL